MGQREVDDYVAGIDKQRARLRRLLKSQDRTVLNGRPANGDWTIVENVRHLLFAEQLHLGAFLPDGFEWSPLGLSQFTAKRFSAVGKKPTRDLVVVFDEWDVIHKPIRKAVKSSSADVERALWRNHRHLGIHIRVIERLLRKQLRESRVGGANSSSP